MPLVECLLSVLDSSIQAATAWRALVRMEQHPSHRAAKHRDSHARRSPGQLGVVVDTHGEPDTAP